jgi:hypothetical protein
MCSAAFINVITKVVIIKVYVSIVVGRGAMQWLTHANTKTLAYFVPMRMSSVKLSFLVPHSLDK